MKVLKAVRSAIAAKLVRNNVRSVQQRLENEERPRDVFLKKRKKNLNLNHPLPWTLYGIFLSVCIFWDPLKSMYTAAKMRQKLEEERKKYIAELDKIYGPSD